MATIQQQKRTIRDIAQTAGVSTKTVSLVLNGRPGVNEKTRSRVLEVVRECGYRPHRGAQMLRGVSTPSIGITLPAPPDRVPLSQSFFVWLFDEIFRIFAPRGYYVTFDLNPYALGPEVDYARGIWESAYGACILCGPIAHDDETLPRIHAAGVPYVAFGRAHVPCSHATVDYEDAAYRSTRFLIERGHQHIGMLKAFTGFHPGLERERGYRRALEESGLPFRPSFIQSVSFEKSDVAAHVHSILEQPEVTALVECSGTEDALAIREGAKRAGRRPGQDFDIVDWSYIENTCVMAEACAHVCLPVREAGSEGLTQLAAWIDGEREGPIEVLYQGTLVEHNGHQEISQLKRLFVTAD
jgi:DNA-binding LacI/PurR family transcriptional regulator